SAFHAVSLHARDQRRRTRPFFAKCPPDERLNRSGRARRLRVPVKQMASCRNDVSLTTWQSHIERVVVESDLALVLLCHFDWRNRGGTVLATRTSVSRSHRPVPRDRTATEKTVVRRAASPAHAGALRRSLDRRERERPRAFRTRPLSRGLLSGARRLARCPATSGAHDEARRARAHRLVHRAGWRAQRTARSVAAHRPSRARARAARTSRIRVAGHGRLL